MGLVLIFALLFVSVVYVDMNNATAKAAEEIRKMRELRRQILIERSRQ